MFEFIHRICRQSSHLCSKLDYIRNGCLFNHNTFMQPLTLVPSRSTKIVKRAYPVPLHKEGCRARFGKKQFYLDLVEDTDVSPDLMIDVVLKSYVKGVGNPGDILTMKRSSAYNSLLVTGLADYATPENLEYAKSIKSDQTVQEKTRTPFEERCLTYLGMRCMSIVMNKENEWTIEPWHIRASFRKAGINIMSESSIELPPEPIKGPDMNLEGKTFFVTITINKKHKVKVRCSIHHWSTAIENRLPYVCDHWLNHGENIFPEEDTKDSPSPSTNSPD